MSMNATKDQVYVITTAPTLLDHSRAHAKLDSVLWEGQNVKVCLHTLLQLFSKVHYNSLQFQRRLIFIHTSTVQIM